MGPLPAKVMELARGATFTQRPELIVAHTHGHGDHIAGDIAFAEQDLSSVFCKVVHVGPASSDVAEFFGLRLCDWPETTTAFDLGGRSLDLFPIPGHEPSHVAVYDPRNRLLLTGDVLYPGRIYVTDDDAMVASARRLVDWVDTHDVDLVLGCHIEMTSSPGVDYPYGCAYQPDEPPLQLTPEHIKQLQCCLTEATCDGDGRLPRIVQDRFIVVPK
mmetsp:Transcript_8514/g.18554  ORF Transcript_8514/g.18554 Transcript_8514/m.18554 type:complete len:216 (-) Transcript_8514:26-673(-)